jgi:hypothetical protein
LTEAFSADLARAVQWRAFVRRSRFESEPGFGRDRGASAALRLSATVGDSAGGRLRSQVEARRTVGVTVAPPSPAGTATVENRSDRSDPIETDWLCVSVVTGQPAFLSILTLVRFAPISGPGPPSPHRSGRSPKRVPRLTADVASRPE